MKQSVHERSTPLLVHAGIGTAAMVAACRRGLTLWLLVEFENERSGKQTLQTTETIAKLPTVETCGCVE